MSAWLTPIRLVPGARLTLACLPHAGASGQVYRAWQSALPADVDLWAVEYPGHGSRIRETPLRSVDALAEGVVEAIVPMLERPLALFGHSMGVLVAFEVARNLFRRFARPPQMLLISGASPATSAYKRPSCQQRNH